MLKKNVKKLLGIVLTTVLVTTVIPTDMSFISAEEATIQDMEEVSEETGEELEEELEEEKETEQKVEEKEEEETEQKLEEKEEENETEQKTEETTQEETETLIEEEPVALMAVNQNVENAEEGLIAKFTFDDEEKGFSGKGAKATAKGDITLSTEAISGKAISLDGSNDWYDITTDDGESLLTGIDEMTISYFSKVSSDGWSFFAAPNTDKQGYLYEHYLGGLDKSTEVRFERYNNNGARPEATIVANTHTDWKHIVLVVEKSKTILYVDGESVSTDSDYLLSDILGDNSVLQLGKGNWGNGEYFRGLIDEVEIYNKALNETEVAELDNQREEEKLTAEEIVAAVIEDLAIINADDIRGNITLPTENKYGAEVIWNSSNSNIISDKDMENDGYDAVPAGVVHRQDADEKVTLTATVSYENCTDTKTFEVTVKKAVEKPELEKYMFTYFPSNSEEQIYFAIGEDAFHFTDLNDGEPVLTSDVGDKGVRDPFIFRSAEGDKFYMIATDLKVETTGWSKAQYQGSLSLVIWESDDLVNWSDARLVDMGMDQFENIGCVWAPEAIYDELTGEYIVFWASMTGAEGVSGTHQVVYYAKTRDFVNFTEAKEYINRDDNSHCIDTTMIKAKDGKYYRASADGEITIETSDSVLGTWREVTTLKELQPNMNGYEDYKNSVNVTLTGGIVEGPELFEMNEGGVYGLYVDNYGSAGYIPITTTDPSDTTGTSYTLYTQSDYDFGSLLKRHGSILGITQKEYDAMKAKWGTGSITNTEDEEEEPVLSYYFDETVNGTEIADSAKEYTGQLHGNATYVEDSEKGKVLYLDGTSGTYASFPQGFFTGRDKVTISMDVKAETVSGNFFVFTAGKNSTKYMFLKTADTSTRFSITKSTWSGEQTASANTTSIKDKWVHWDIVVTPKSTKIYQDGVQIAENDDISISVSDLGKDLLAYLGKSFYDADSYFKGYFDNVNVYNRALSEEEIAKKQGIILCPILDIVGTDITFMKKIDVDNEKREITIYPSLHNSEADLKNAYIEVLLRDNATMTAWLLPPYSLSGGFSFTVGYDYNGDGTKTDELWQVKTVICGNPVLGGQYADPDIDILDGKYYIYPTTDGYSGWSGTQFHVFSSDNLKDWTDHGVILDLATDDVPWSDGSAWAPSIEEKNGKYYFYFCGNDTSTNKKAIGVAVADSPTGPFVAQDKPLITMELCASEGISMGQAIDPSIFTDEDGTSYMTFGNGSAAIVELAEDMTSIVSGTMKNISGLTDFRESVIVTKRDGLYHFTWSCDDTGSENYRVNYGTSDSLYGSVTYRNTILSKDADQDMLGTGHHSIVQIPGEDEYYIAYHRFVTPLGQYTSGFGYHREVCIDKLTFGEDGYMEVVTPTLTGVAKRNLVDTGTGDEPGDESDGEADDESSTGGQTGSTNSGNNNNDDDDDDSDSESSSNRVNSTAATNVEQASAPAVVTSIPDLPVAQAAVPQSSANTANTTKAGQKATKAQTVETESVEVTGVEVEDKKEPEKEESQTSIETSQEQPSEKVMEVTIPEEEVAQNASVDAMTQNKSARNAIWICLVAIVAGGGLLGYFRWKKIKK